MTPYSMGADESPKDIRTFAYVPTKANVKGGVRWEPKDIDHQHKVGICTIIWLTMNAQKVWGIKFSPDFLTLIQKKFYDKKWDEGSCMLFGLKAGKNVGFLPTALFKNKKGKPYITEADRKLPWAKYVAKLQAIPDSEIERLKKLASKYKLAGYEYVAIDRDLLANAIDASEAGIGVRFLLGKEWWTPPIEPLRPPVVPISGHAINVSNYHGRSFRSPNSWGKDWADGGTAYWLIHHYKPTEAWIPYYNEIPDRVARQLERRETFIGFLVDVAQKVVELFRR